MEPLVAQSGFVHILPDCAASGSIRLRCWGLETQNPLCLVKASLDTPNQNVFSALNGLLPDGFAKFSPRHATLYYIYSHLQISDGSLVNFFAG